MKQATKQNKWLYLLFLLMPFVDMFTGYLLNCGIYNVFSKTGQLYRIVFIAYLAYLVFVKNKAKNTKWLIALSGYLVCLVALYTIRFDSSLVTNASYAMKLLFPIYLCYGISFQMREDKFDLRWLFEAYSWIFPLSMVIPRLFNIGFYNYYNQSGFKGFYYANNEVNVILMVLFVFCFSKLYEKITIKTLVQLALCAMALLFIGSKTSFMAIPIVLVFFVIFKPHPNKKRFVKTILGIGAGGAVAAAVLLSEQLVAIFKRLTEMYRFYAGTPNAFLTFLLSERNLRIGPAAEHFFTPDKWGLVNFLFGIGKDEKCPTDTIYGIFSIVEMDFFDTMFWFGIITACVVVAFYIIVFVRSCFKRGCFSEKVMFCLVFAFSMLAGHVMMSANAGTILGLVLAALYCSRGTELEISTENVEIRNIDKTKKLAVLMSTYNGEQYIRQQIDSILAQQTDFEFELLVRDDGSTDATKEILQEYADNKKLKWFSGENLKPAKSFLSLLKAAQGYDFYAFADQDDIWHPNKLQYGVSAIADKEGPAMSFANARLVDAGGSYLGREVYKHRPCTDFYSLACGASILGCTVIFNKELASIVQREPLPDELVMHDAYISILCALFDGAIVYDSKPHMDYRQHGKNVVGTNWTKLDAVKDRLYKIIKPQKVSFATMAKNICELYPQAPNDKKLKFLKRVADYRSSFFKAAALAFDSKPQYDSLNMEITIRGAILFRNR